MNLAINGLLGIFLGGATFCCAAQGPEPAAPAAKTEITVVEVDIPPQVAESAAKRAAGDLASPPPVLVLEGLEVDPSESLSVEVRGPRQPEQQAPGPILAVTGTVAAPSDPNAPGRHRLDLLIPLAGEVARLLTEAQKAGRGKIALELAAVGQKLVFGRAFLQVPAPPSP